MLKLLVLFGITVMVFFFQIYSQSAQTKNDVTDLLDILKKIIDESTEEAKPILNAAAAKIESTGGSVETQAEGAMNTVGDEFKGQLDTIKGMADDVGVNIDVCLIENEDKLINLTHEDLTYLLRNVSYKVTEGISYVVEAMRNIENLNNEIADFEQELSDCEGDVSSTNCFDKVSAKIEAASISFPNDIRKFVKTGQLLADQSCTGIEDYLSAVFSNIQSEGGALLTTIFNCVEGMIK